MNTPFQVEKITVYPLLNRIKIDSHYVSIEPRVMKLLVHLVEKEGALCTREELIEHIWGGDFVNKNALTRAMSDLRKAFKDATDRPQYFETIPKQGYRFIASIKRLEEAPKTKEKRVSPVYWRMAAALLLIIASVMAYSALTTPKITYGNKVVKKSVPVIVEDSTGMSDSALHRKVEAIVDAELVKEMREE